jgi:hypothetical protein
LRLGYWPGAAPTNTERTLALVLFAAVGNQPIIIAHFAKVAAGCTIDFVLVKAAG